MKNIEPNLCYKYLQLGESDMEGLFDLDTKQWHGPVCVATHDQFEFKHMEQG